MAYNNQNNTRCVDMGIMMCLMCMYSSDTVGVEWLL